MNKAGIAALALLFALPLYAHAAAQGTTQSQNAKPGTTGANQDSGTTIVGSEESPIGLVIAPWKDDFSQQRGIELRRHLDEAPVPIDPEVFHRRIEYYDSIAAHRKAQLDQHAPSTP